MIFCAGSRKVFILLLRSVAVTITYICRARMETRDQVKVQFRRTGACNIPEVQQKIKCWYYNFYT